MPSTTAHFIVGAALSLPAIGFRPWTEILPRWAIPVTCGLLATAPDLDLAGRRLFGISNSSVLSHRGFFHSPFFLILFAAAIAAVVLRVTGHHSRKAFACLWLLWVGCMLTHPLLDALTDGGRGVMLLLPFTEARIYFPWRPIFTPPGGTETLFSRAWQLRYSEIPFCLTAAAIGISGLIARKFSSSSI